LDGTQATLDQALRGFVSNASGSATSSCRLERGAAIEALEKTASTSVGGPIPIGVTDFLVIATGEPQENNNDSTWEAKFCLSI
jgi:hypothetical protein